jgi:thymidylate kinase
MIVEFAGLPGAGKTTAARRLVAGLAATGHRCRARCLPPGGPFDQARHYARFTARLVSQPSRLAPAVRCAAAVRPCNAATLRYALKLPLWPYRFAVVREDPSVTVVLDQGVVQHAWSGALGGTVVDERALRSALRIVLTSVPLTYAFVYFDADVALAVDRIGARASSTSRFDRMSPMQARGALQRHRSALEWMLEEAVTITGGACLRVDAARPVDDTCRTIAAFLETLERT